MLTYGLLVRTVLWLIAHLRLRVATAQLLLDHPQVKALLDRMSTAQIELNAVEPETPRVAADHRVAAAPGRSLGSTAVIVWSGALSIDAVSGWVRERLHRDVIRSVEAGGGRALATDTDMTRAIGAARPDCVVVLVRAWEAPLLDLQDFLVELRGAVGRDCSIVLAPVGAQAQAPTTEQKTIWSRWASRLADPALYVEAGA